MKAVIVLCVVLLLVGCQSEEGEAVYHKIDAKEAKEMMTEDAYILDVRTDEEYQSGHIAGANLIPVDVIESGDESGLPDKDQLILVYCRSGNRSGVASKKLVELGYTNVYDFGGINDWPYEIVQ